MDPATNYHESIADLRAALMQAHVAWQSRADERMSALSDTDASDDAKFALAASLMAANYSYTLAALLGIAEKAGTDNIAVANLAAHLAFECDEILTNGDFDDHNADVPVTAMGKPLGRHLPQQVET
jgi:hypothetical protein